MFPRVCVERETRPHQVDPGTGTSGWSAELETEEGSRGDICVQASLRGTSSWDGLETERSLPATSVVAAADGFGGDVVWTRRGLGAARGRGGAPVGQAFVRLMLFRGEIKIGHFLSLLISDSFVNI